MRLICHEDISDGLIAQSMVLPIQIPVVLQHYWSRPTPVNLLRSVSENRH